MGFKEFKSIMRTSRGSAVGRCKSFSLIWSLKIFEHNERKCTWFVSPGVVWWLLVLPMGPLTSSEYRISNILAIGHQSPPPPPKSRSPSPILARSPPSCPVPVLQQPCLPLRPESRNYADEAVYSLKHRLHVDIHIFRNVLWGGGIKV